MNTQQQIKSILAISLASVLMITSPLLQAGERESLEQLRSTTLNLIDMLVSEGVLSKSKADILKKDAEAARVASMEKDALEKGERQAEKGEPINEVAKKTVRVQYVPEFIKKEMREEIKKDMMAKLNYKVGERLGMPEWIDRIEWTGDVRLRFERNVFVDSNAKPIYFTNNENRNAATVANTTEDRDRLRLRARLGANIKVNDWITSGIRMTTGSTTDPVSPNQTMQSVDSKYSFALDRAFLKAQITQKLSVTGGRMDNPFFSTDIVWDPDLAFDGVFAKYTPQLTDSISAFATGGAFPIAEIQTSDTNKAKSKWLFGGQTGIEWKVNQTTTKLAIALYDFENVEGTANPLGDSNMYKDTAPAFRQKGNRTFSINAQNGTFCGAPGSLSGPCGLASKFRELNLIGQMDIANFNPVHVILTADYVRNIGFDSNDFASKTGLALGSFNKENQAYQIKLSMGMPKVVNAHDWEIFGAYKRLESDSVLDAFTDSDFHLGGTDAKGWILGASYGIDKNAWVTGRWFSADQISGLPLGIDVLMLDFNAKF